MGESYSNSSGIGSSKLDKHLKTLDEKLSGGAEDNQINRVVSNGILKLPEEAMPQAIDALRGRGLDEHADILADYASGDLGKRDARNALRAVEINPVARLELAPVAPYTVDHSVTIEEAMASFSEGMDKLAPVLEEASAAMAAMQDSITPEAIEAAMISQGIDPDSMSDEQKSGLRDDVRSMIATEGAKSQGNIDDALSPENVRAMMRDAMDGVPAMVDAQISTLLRSQFDRAAEGGASVEQVVGLCEKVAAQNPAYKGLDCANVGAPPAP